MSIFTERFALKVYLSQAFAKHFAKCKNEWDGRVVRGAGFEPEVQIEVLLRVRVYDFLVSKKQACLREVVEGVGDDPNRVGDCLRHLWKGGFLLRTRKPVYEFGLSHKGRAGLRARL